MRSRKEKIVFILATLAALAAIGLAAFVLDPHQIIAAGLVTAIAVVVTRIKK